MRAFELGSGRRDRQRALSPSWAMPSSHCPCLDERPAAEDDCMRSRKRGSISSVVRAKSVSRHLSGSFQLRPRS